MTKRKRRPRRLSYLLLICIVVVLILALRDVQPNMTCRGIDPQHVGSVVGMNQRVVECLEMAK